MRYLLILLIRGYQLGISPLLPPSCRFIPSCSEYAKQALETHGLVRGTMLSGWRLLRCQPFCAGGLDPVPEPRRATHGTTAIPSPAAANLNPPNS
ncbi:membrane protein insertion efficiency factor YidD [Desulfonatronum thiodismutans]|uniref:membrane protein insertion efficiency factor YidD n=1 Tax=Desulfonatronum thiodismutans TaxID=159290 RepID=UPI0004ABE47D|nr:membrane protein insertion efficiency factor YidD [Desulfonatronum thiodismutans]